MCLICQRKLSGGSLEEHMAALTVQTVTFEDGEDGMENIPIEAADSQTVETSHKEALAPPAVAQKTITEENFFLVEKNVDVRELK